MIHRIVTGAAGFIGSAIARSLRETPGRLLPVDQIPADGCEQIDVNDDAFARRLGEFLSPADRAELYLAAGAVPELAEIADIAPEDFHRAVADTLTMNYAAARSFANYIAARPIRGSITFLGSIGGSRSHRYKIAYDAAMAGIEAVGRGFALEYATAGVTTRVAAIGPIAGSASSLADGDSNADLVALVPANYYPPVDDVAAAVIALGGPAFDIATGAVVPLDAGLGQQLCPATIERRP